MPMIPTYNQPSQTGGRLSPATAKVPAPPPMLQASSEMFGSGGPEAGLVAGALQDIGKAGAAMATARRETELQNRKLRTEIAFSEFEKRLITRNDFGQFEPEFDGLVSSTMKSYEQEVKDPLVLRDLQAHLIGLQVRKSPTVRKQAWDKEIAFGDASNLEQKNGYLNLYGTAAPEERARYVENYRQATRNSIAVGYLKPEEGVKRLSDFLNKTSIVDAQQDLRRDPENFDPDKYPFLQGADRIRLGDHAIKLVEQNQRERTRQEEKAERAREKQLKDFQDQNARNMWVKVDKGLTIPEVEDGIQRRLIPLDEGKALKKSLAAEDRAEDPLAKFSLRNEIEEGRAGRREVLSSFLKGEINDKTRETYLEKVFSREKAGDMYHNPEYKDAEQYIKSQLKTTGVMDKFDTDEAARIGAATDELEKRVTAGEPIRDVRDDIVRRYAVAPAGLNAVPKPIYGDKENPGEAFRKTEAAYAEGKIDYNTYRREVLNLKKIQEILDRQVPAPDAEAVKKKLKERKK